MTDRVPPIPRAAAALDGAAASPLALVWFGPAAIVVAVVTMPYGVTGAASWVIAVTAQVAFSAFVIMWRARLTAVRHRRFLMATAIVIAGGLRGVILVGGAAWASGQAASTLVIAARAANSAVICLLALGVLGIVIRGTSDFRRDYRLLLDRAIRLQQDDGDGGRVLDPALIAHWIGIQHSLARAADTSREHLDRADVDAADLQAAADLIGDLLENDVRPVSHGLWMAKADQPPRLRRLQLGWDALRPWRPPLLAIGVIYACISLIGSTNRAGLGDGLLFAVYSTATVLAVLWTSHWIGRHIPRSRIVGVATLVVLPIAVTTMAQAIGQGLLRAPADLSGAIIAGLSASILTEAVVLAQRVSTERHLLLDELQHSIDAQALGLLGRPEAAGHWERRLGTFVHHSVQSELIAMRLHLQEAAREDEPEGRFQASTEALVRFERLLALEPPWQGSPQGRVTVTRVARAWEGIAQVSCTLTPHGSAAQWRTIGEVVEEGVANAIRGGHARRVEVTVTAAPHDALVVTIEDDGDGPNASCAAGLGTWWLDRVAPGGWDRSRTSDGTRLVVHIA